MQADRWTDRARADPGLSLFLAAHWDHISAPEGLRRSLLDAAPPHCLNKNALYKHAVNMCGEAVSNAHPSFCQGAQPLSCANHLLPRSRDAAVYRAMCANRLRAKQKQPACQFCRELIAAAAASTGATDRSGSATPVCDDAQLMDECVSLDRRVCV